MYRRIAGGRVRNWHIVPFGRQGRFRSAFRAFLPFARLSVRMDGAVDDPNLTCSVSPGSCFSAQKSAALMFSVGRTDRRNRISFQRSKVPVPSRRDFSFCARCIVLKVAGAANDGGLCEGFRTPAMNEAAIPLTGPYRGWHRREPGSSCAPARARMYCSGSARSLSARRGPRAFA
jgi:hypothetical protein